MKDAVLGRLADASHGNAVDRAEIVGLAARLGIEVRARKDQSAPLRGLEALQDVGLELERVGIGEVEPLGGHQ
jgi:hypothetical protein